MSQQQEARRVWVVRLSSWTNARLTSVADLRDLVLIVAGGLYLLGYIVWAFNAYANNLGLLPALDLQYLIAGIVPALLLLMLTLLITGLLRFKRWLNDWLDPDLRWKRHLRNLNMIVLGLALAALLLATSEWFELASPEWSRKLAMMSTPVMLVSMFLLTPGAEKSSPVLQLFSKYGTFAAVAFVLFMTVLGLMDFASRLYPRVPQEFGGVRPRCAYVDVKTEEVSSAVQQSILPAAGPDAAGKIARSVQLDVHFSDGGLMLVKPHAERPEFRSPTFEIKKDAVQAVVWCD